jgi:hypothetical protein
VGEDEEMKKSPSRKQAESPLKQKPDEDDEMEENAGSHGENWWMTWQFQPSKGSVVDNG